MTFETQLLDKTPHFEERGEEPDAWWHLLDRKMTFAMPINRAGGIKQTVWTNVTRSWQDWLGKSLSAGRDETPIQPLTSHTVRAEKGISPIVFGTLAQRGNRTKNGMKAMEALALDIDGFHSFEEALAAVEAKGWACLAYTSFSHMKTESKEPRDLVREALGATGDVAVDGLKSYLVKKGKLAADVIDSVKILSQGTQDQSGMQILFQHAPIEKFRLVFPLADVVEIDSLARNLAAGQALWSAKLRGLAQELGLTMDQSCTATNAAFYLPTCSQDSVEHRMVLLKGKPVDFHTLPSVEAPKRGVAGNAFAQAGAGTEGRDLKRWVAHYGRRIRITELLEARGRGAANGGLTVECPFDAEHSNAGDQDDAACWAKDTDGESGFVWACRRDSCAGHDRLDFVQKALDEGWFTMADLTDEAFLEPLADQDMDLIEDDSPAPVDPRFEPVTDWLPTGYKIKGGEVWRKGQDEDTRLCQAFNVIGRASNLAGDADAGRIIAFTNENGVEVELTLYNRDLITPTGAGVLEALGDAGMRIFAREPKERGSLLDLFNRMTPRRRIPTGPRPGWIRSAGGEVDGFLAPTGEYIAAKKGTQYRLVESSIVRDRAAAGDMAGWQVAASAALAQTGTNFHWPLGLCAGFAGPLLGLIRGTPCGFNLSGDTSQGKTMAQRLAASVWATPSEKQGVLFSMNTTTNAAEDLAGVGTETFLALDEIGAMQNPKDLSNLLFTLSTGTGKSRKAGRGRGLAETADFRPFVILSNERPLRTVVQDAGGDYKTGLSVRFPDLDVSAGEKVDAETIQKLEGYARHYGHAGPAFIRWLVENDFHSSVKTAELKKRIDEAAKAFPGAGETPAKERAAKVFGLVQLAGQLAVEAGILTAEDAKAAIKGAVLTAWATFQSSNEGRLTSGPEAMLDGFRSWIKREEGRSLIAKSDHGEPRSIPVVGFYDGKEYILIASHIDMKAMGLNGTVTGLTKALQEIGALIPADLKNLKHTSLPKLCGGGKVPNYRIDAKKLGMHADQETGEAPQDRAKAA